MDKSVSISESAEIGSNCSFGYNVVIEEGVRLGDGVVLGHGVVLLSETELGEGVEVGAGSVLGKPPRTPASSRRQTGATERLIIGGGSMIGASAVIHRGSVFGVDCYVGDLAALREDSEFGEGVLIGRSVSMESNVRIGDRSRVLTGAYVTGETTVEENVFIGPMVVTTNDRYMSMWKEKTYRGPLIKREAAVGAGASLLSGITVGEHAVIGMGAAVVTDVPAGRIYVGVPAKDAGEVRVT